MTAENQLGQWLDEGKEVVCLFSKGTELPADGFITIDFKGCKELQLVHGSLTGYIDSELIKKYVDGVFLAKGIWETGRWKYYKYYRGIPYKNNKPQSDYHYFKKD